MCGGRIQERNWMRRSSIRRRVRSSGCVVSLPHRLARGSPSSEWYPDRYCPSDRVVRRSGFSGVRYPSTTVRKDAARRIRIPASRCRSADGDFLAAFFVDFFAVFGATFFLAILETPCVGQTLFERMTSAHHSPNRFESDSDAAAEPYHTRSGPRSEAGRFAIVASAFMQPCAFSS